jgi:uncharacterized protein (TIGR02271 family)
MLSMDQFRTLVGRRLRSRDGHDIGKIDQLYADSEGGSPTFVTVNTGLFGSNTTFVPVGDASMQGDDLAVPYSKDQVKDAPNVAPDGELSAEEEDRLYAHYGLGTGQAQADTEVPDGASAGAGAGAAMQTGATGGTTGTTGASGGATGAGLTGGLTGGRDRDGDGVRDDAEARGAVGHDTSGPTTDSAMTRSEEQLRVGTQQVEAGRARLRKYVVTENVTETVPVTREEVRVEREPITDGNMGAAMDGPAISEEEHEVVLTEERPVVEKEAVPVERIRLDKETVTEQQTVSDEVRKEQVEVDGDQGGRLR